MNIAWGEHSLDFSWLGGLMLGIGSIGSAIAGWLIGWHTRRRDWVVEAEHQTEMSEQRGRTARRENADAIEAITHRFEVLISGYETRIIDLTREVHELRAEVVRLRTFIDQNFMLIPTSTRDDNA